MAGEQSEQQELVLLDEPSTADLRAKVTEAWQDFAGALGALLAGLVIGAYLEITLDPTASGTGDAVYSVSVQSAGDGELIAQAVGNSSLPDGYRLDRASVAAMVALGWAPPGVLPGSGENFGLRTEPAHANQLAAILSRTLRDVYGAPHPAFLVYLVHDDQEGPVPAGPLGTARHESSLEATVEPAVSGGALSPAARAVPDAPSGAAAAGSGEEGLVLAEQVRTVVAALLKSTPEQLQSDADGDINIRAGSAMVFVRVRDNPPLVDVFSPVLTEIEPTERLYVKLSELTNRMPIGRLYCADDTVWASIPVFGRNFQATHLMLAIQVMTGLADELDDRLHGEFGGRRFFGESDKPAIKGNAQGEGVRTGMYL